MRATARGFIQLLLLMLLPAPAAVAQNPAWINGTTGSWFVPSNWTPPVVPSATLSAAILGDGTVVIDGAAAASQTLALGFVGDAVLTIQNGGSLTHSQYALMGSTAHATMIVTGSGSSWTVNGASLHIGEDTTATLLVQAGGHVTTSAGTPIAIGLDQPFYSSDVTITGAGSTLVAGNQISIGTRGDGTLTIANGGSVTTPLPVEMALAMGGTAALHLNGTAGARGILTAPGIAAGTGSGGAQIRFDGGTLRAAANSTNFLSGFAAGEVTIGPGGAFFSTNGFTTTIANGISGGGAFTKQGGGVLILTGANTYSGGTTVSTGALRVGNGGTTGSIAGDVAIATNLIFNRSNSLTFGGDFSGAGALTKQGAGMLTLTGAGSHTGGTTISAGTLRIGNGGTVGSIAGDVTDNGELVFDRSDNLVFSGVTSGSGGFTKQGAGTLTLTDASSYTGGTTINEGTLRIGNGGTTGSITGSVANDGALAFNRSDNVSFAGIVSGSGSLVKQGAGMLTLTSANSYSGGTTISAGILRVGAGSTSGSIVGNVANAGSLIFNRSNAVSFDGAVSGAGSLTKQGAGTLTLTGAGTYTGATTISAGALRIGNGGTTGSIAGNIVNTGSLSFDRSNNLIYAGVVSGTGSLTQQGVGQLTLSGDSSYSGGTTVSAGTLRIGNAGTTGSIAGNVVDNGSVIFDRSNNLTFAGAISGSGGLVKQGTGTLTLSGINTYAGTTSVSAGVLRINGSLASTATSVAAGATLGGNGSAAGPVTLANGATLAPGTSAGTFTASALNWNGGASLAFELGANDAASDHLVLAGALAKQGTTTYAFAFTDAATPPGLGPHTLITFGSQSGYSASDFSYSYTGSRPGLVGAFVLTPTALLFDVVGLPVELDSFSVE